MAARDRTGVRWWLALSRGRRVAAVTVVLVLIAGLWWLYAPPGIERPSAPVWCPDGTRGFDAREILGQSLQDGTERALDNGCSVRQINSSGSIGDSLDTGRINVEVERDAITRIDGIY